MNESTEKPVHNRESSNLANAPGRIMNSAIEVEALDKLPKIAKNGPKPKFECVIDAPHVNGYYISNQYTYGKTHPHPTNEKYNPFSYYRKKFGTQDLQGLWFDSYSSPYKEDDAFKTLLSAICTGSCAMVAQVYDERRNGHPGMAQRSQQMLGIWVSMLQAQCKVLTDAVLSHYLTFCHYKHDAYTYIQEAYQDNFSSLILTFVPQFTLDFGALQKRYLQTHSVVIKGYIVQPDGIMKVYVWDPNHPSDDKRFLLLNIHGQFSYTTRIGDRDVTINSNEGSTHTTWGDMGCAPIPCSAYFQGKKPFFELWKVAFGITE